MTPRQVAEALRQAGNLPELLREAGGALEAVGIICNHLEEACALCPDFEALALAIEADDAVREQLVAALTDMRQWVARICKAHGWILDCRDRPIEEGYWPLVRGWAEGTDEPICLPPAILAALDPDRPPPPSELKKLTQLEAAALEFCRRVESGEIRSRRSYQAFKVALGEKPATICDHDWAIKDGHCWVCDAEWPEVGDG